VRKYRSQPNERRTGQVDLKATFKIGPVNGLKAQESSLWSKVSVAPVIVGRPTWRSSFLDLPDAVTGCDIFSPVVLAGGDPFRGGRSRQL
jgi:hypothetical protein